MRRSSRAVCRSTPASATTRASSSTGATGCSRRFSGIAGMRPERSCRPSRCAVRSGIDQGFTFFDDGMPGAWRDAATAEQVAERWLRSTGTPRAFLFLHLFGPHGPRRSSGASDGNAYDGAVSEADEAVGRLVKYLKANQLYDQSTIVLLSDHGQGLGDHGEDAHGLLVYDEALRVPLIIKPAASEESGRRLSALVQLADIAPTVLDLGQGSGPGRSRRAIARAAACRRQRLPCPSRVLGVDVSALRVRLERPGDRDRRTIPLHRAFPGGSSARCGALRPRRLTLVSRRISSARTRLLRSRASRTLSWVSRRMRPCRVERRCRLRNTSATSRSVMSARRDRRLGRPHQSLETAAPFIRATGRVW